MLGLLVLAVIASSWCWRRLKVSRRHGQSNQTCTWKKRRQRVGGGNCFTFCLCKRPHEGERVTGQLSHNTFSTAHEYNGTWSTRKKLLCVWPYHAGLCCKRSIAILKSRRVQKTVFFSRRNSIETVMVSVPLDVLNQYFGMFVKMGL